MSAINELNMFCKRLLAGLLLLSLCLVTAGCHVPQACCDINMVQRSLQCRVQDNLVTNFQPCSEVIPSDVTLEDGLLESEAVATGLANNSLFQAALSQLGMLGGDAKQASLLTNPQFLIYFPAGSKEGQYTIYAPIESYFLRPTRVKVANREFQRVGEQLVQNGLNVARDIRLAYVDLAVATEQVHLASEGIELRGKIASLTRSRFDKGDISELETVTSKVDALNAKSLRIVQNQSVGIAQARLATQMGIPTREVELMTLPLETTALLELDEDQLINTALCCRPDYHAAQWAIAASQERAKLSRWIFWRVDSVLDVRDGPGYTRTGSGLRFDLPIFNRNQGGILRADWELNAALHNRDAIRDQIYQDVRVASRQLKQSQNNLAVLEGEVLPNLNESVQIAEKGFSDGGTDYLLVLQSTTQYLDARSRILDQRAAVRRATAELERSVGRSLFAAPLNIEQMVQETLSTQLKSSE